MSTHSGHEAQNQPLIIFNEHDFAQDYPTATPDQLAETWSDNFPSEEALRYTSSALGVYRKPEVQPPVVVSVDLCEVVRQTHLAIRHVEELPGKSNHREPYGYGLSALTTETHMNNMLRVLMNHDLVQPDPEAPGVASFLRNWRRIGAYVIANTATGEGCELSTVRFLGQHLPGAFDGILFARNYDDTGPIKKGHVAREVVDAIAPQQPVSVIHIDDATRHLTSFRPVFEDRPNTTVATFQPRYENVAPDPNSPGSTSRLETFALAHHHITAELARLSLSSSPQKETP